jgi:hypothetical protein
MEIGPLMLAFSFRRSVEDAGAEKGAGMGPLTLAFPLRWSEEDAGVRRPLALGRKPEWVAGVRKTLA